MCDDEEVNKNAQPKWLCQIHCTLWILFARNILQEMEFDQSNFGLLYLLVIHLARICLSMRVIFTS